VSGAGRSTVAWLVAALLAGVLAAEAQIRFREVSEERGVDFVHAHGGQGDFFMIETMGSGVVAFDYDRDGDDDLLFIQSGELPVAAPEARAVGPRSRLFRNDGGRFVDVTSAAGIDLDVYGMGGTAGDVDGDGDVDLFVTAYGANRLLRNNGNGTFTDATNAAGVGEASWGASASLADVDRDGDLDLYVTNYVAFTFDDNPLCGLPDRGLRSYCHPDVYDGLPDRFYRNRGDGTFEDATAEAGFADADGKGLGVIFGDIDRDGDDDLYVANDMTPNFLFLNDGKGVFEDAALVSGVAFDERGNAEAGMGLALGDLDGNGFADILVTHLDGQTNAYYSNTGSGLFVDRRFPSKLAETSFHKVGFGIDLADFDQDGALDVLVANGHIIHNVDEWGTTTSFKQGNQVLRNLGDGRLEEVEDAGLDVVRSSRGMAIADLDGDGDPDLAINNSTDPAEVYENVTGEPGGWLQVTLSGPEPLVGTGLELRVGDGKPVLWRELRASSSYMSQGSSSVHFGLGDAAEVAGLTIFWPDGGRRQLRRLPVDRRIEVSR
jgi:hypothetical protein